MQQQHASREKEKGRAQGKQSRAQGKSQRQAGNDKSQQSKASSIRQKGTTEGAQQKAIKPKKTALQLVQCTVCASKTSSLR